MFREERRWGDRPNTRFLTWPTTIAAVVLIVLGTVGVHGWLG